MHTPVEVVAEYQCPGCMHGPKAPECPKYIESPDGCKSHAPGTMMTTAGWLALGLPKGFHRFGPRDAKQIEVYSSYESMMAGNSNLSSIYSVPVWKYLDEHGNTIMRWYSPRINSGWSLVVCGDCRDKFPNAIEITAKEISEMD